MSRLFIGADHAGFSLKKILLSEASTLLPGVEWIDLGTSSAEASVDYPNFSAKVSEAVLRENARGILVCGSGIGVAIAANRFRGIRAATAWDVTSAHLCREHNDANILCLGSRLLGETVAKEMVVAWWKAVFQGGRHAGRVQLMDTFGEEK